MFADCWTAWDNNFGSSNCYIWWSQIHFKGLLRMRFTMWPCYLVNQLSACAGAVCRIEFWRFIRKPGVCGKPLPSGSTPGRVWNIVLLVPHQDGTNLVRNVITSLGPWSTFEPLSCRCNQQDSPIFPGHSCHVVETS